MVLGFSLLLKDLVHYGLLMLHLLQELHNEGIVWGAMLRLSEVRLRMLLRMQRRMLLMLRRRQLLLLWWSVLRLLLERLSVLRR